jgi:hypothetical protein
MMAVEMKKRKSGIVLAEIAIYGTSPLLMDKIPDDAKLPGAPGGATTVHVSGDNELTPREKAEKSAHMFEDGSLYIPGVAIYKTIQNAGKFHKLGKKQITTQTGSIFPAGVWILEEVCPLNTSEFEVLSRIVKRGDGSKVWKHSARVDKWDCKFTLQIDTDFMPVSIVRLLVDDAGKRVGVLAWSPRCGGPYGRFAIKSWAILDTDLECVA